MAPDTATRYDTDFFLWTQVQAAALRDGKAQELDWANLAEEIESLGKSDRRALGSRLEGLVMHLLKWHYQPSGHATGHSWYSTTLNFSLRHEVARLIVWHVVTRPVVPSAVSYADVREGNAPYIACGHGTHSLLTGT